MTKCAPVTWHKLVIQQGIIITIRFFPHSWVITGFITRITRWVPHVDAWTVYPSGAPELTPDFSGVCLSVLFLLTIVLSVRWFTTSDYPLLSSVCSYLWICMSLLFSFNHYINCPLIDGFWLPFWYLQTFNICGSVFVLFLLVISLSVRRFTTSDNPFDIFW